MHWPRLACHIKQFNLSVLHQSFCFDTPVTEDIFGGQGPFCVSNKRRKGSLCETRPFRTPGAEVVRRKVHSCCVMWIMCDQRERERDDGASTCVLLHVSQFKEAS